MFQDIPQPVFDLVEEGEGLQEERSETEGREDTVEIKEALVDMVVVVVGESELKRENSGMESFVCGKSRLCIFQILFWSPGVFFS